MKRKAIILSLVLGLCLAFAQSANAIDTKNARFTKQFFFEYGGKGSQSGLDVSNAKEIADTDIFSIPAGVVIEKVYIIIETGLTGTTAMTIGDDDAAAGFVPNASITLGTAGIYGYDAKNAGAYLRVETAGASDATDIYVVPNAKYYSATGKEIKLDVTTTNTAGKFRVVVEGFRI